MLFYRKIMPTDHYLEEHEQYVPWEKVIELIHTTKNPRKRGERFEIKKEGYYIIGIIRNNTLYVINAKKS